MDKTTHDPRRIEELISRVLDDDRLIHSDHQHVVFDYTRTLMQAVREFRTAYATKGLYSNELARLLALVPDKEEG